MFGFDLTRLSFDFVQGSNLFMGNIGDSRAILGSKDSSNDTMVATQLTVDLKPDLPSIYSLTPIHIFIVSL